MSERRRRTILFLAANPDKTKSLALEVESREIDEGLRRARRRREFDFEQKWAISPLDLQRALLDYEPLILHFAGHGAGERGIVLRDDDGSAKPVAAAALEDLFELYPQVECVLLNACYSEVQAKAIAKHVPYVIGMKNAIGDNAAIKFATGFYDALGAGRPIDLAFKSGCTAIQMEGLAGHLTPVFHRSRVKPSLNTPRADQHRRTPSRSAPRSPAPSGASDFDRADGSIKHPIKHPRRPQLVWPTFRCSGVVRGMDPAWSLRLGVEVGRLVWPKENKIVVDKEGKWSVTVFEDGAVDKFAVALFLVDSAVDRWIMRWLERGRVTGDYAGLKGMPGARTRRLDRVEGLRLRRDEEGTRTADSDIVGRRLKWYEETSETLAAMKHTIETATLEKTKEDGEAGSRNWHEVQQQYLGLARVLNQAKLLAPRPIVGAISKLVDRYDGVSDQTEGFDERELAANHNKVRKLTAPLERANDVLRTEWRRLSGIEA